MDKSNTSFLKWSTKDEFKKKIITILFAGIILAAIMISGYTDKAVESVQTKTGVEEMDIRSIPPEETAASQVTESVATAPGQKLSVPVRLPGPVTRDEVVIPNYDSETEEKYLNEAMLLSPVPWISLDETRLDEVYPENPPEVQYKQAENTNCLLWLDATYMALEDGYLLSPIPLAWGISYTTKGSRAEPDSYSWAPIDANTGEILSIYDPRIDIHGKNYGWLWKKKSSYVSTKNLHIKKPDFISLKFCFLFLENNHYTNM
jgi:hypothetical protein